MSRLHEVVRQVAADLERAQVRWALIGGLAISVRTEPRFTRDVDLAIAVTTDSEAEQVVRGLVSIGYCTVFTLEQKAVARLATVRLEPPDAGVVVDLLFASTGIEKETVEAAETIDVAAGLCLPVASLSHLLAMKTLSRDDLARPLDLADLRQLLARATPADIDGARAALQSPTDPVPLNETRPPSRV